MIFENWTLWAPPVALSVGGAQSPLSGVVSGERLVSAQVSGGERSGERMADDRHPVVRPVILSGLRTRGNCEKSRKPAPSPAPRENSFVKKKRKSSRSQRGGLAWMMLQIQELLTNKAPRFTAGLPQRHCENAAEMTLERRNSVENDDVAET